MKIKMQGSELKKVDIEYLSLVKRGANRSPFKVVKTETPTEKTGLVGAVQKFFSLNDIKPTVVAVFVEKTAFEQALPNLADAGFALDKHEMHGDMAVFKQAGFEECDQVIMVKSEARVGFALANTAAHADIFTGKLSFDPSVAVDGFYPGPNAALAAYQAAMNVEKAELNDFLTYLGGINSAIPDSVKKFEALQRGFGSVTSDATGETSAKTPSEIAKAATALAATLLKAGKGIQEEAKGDTGASSSGADQNSTTEGSDDSPDDEASKMSKGATDKTETVVKTEAAKVDAPVVPEVKPVEKSYRPKVMKDAEGKEYILAIAPTGIVMKYSPGAKIPEGHTTMTEEWDQEGSLGGGNNGNGQGQGKAKASEGHDNEVAHTGAGGDRGNMDGSTPAGSLKKEEIDTVLKSLAELPALVAELAKSVKAQGEELKKSTTRLDSIEKTAQEAVKKAEGTVVHVTAVHDSAYENLGGSRRPAVPARTARQIAKAEFSDDLWKGTFGALEAGISSASDRIPGVESV